MDRAPVCACCREHLVQHEWRPFCSERCKLLDLARWVDGEYRIPGDPTPPDPERSDTPEE